MRYEGHYAIRDRGELGGEASSPRRTSWVELWDMPDRNEIYRSFDVVAGRPTIRRARQEYTFRRFHAFFGHEVLDVGCDGAVLRGVVPCRYVGLDLAGEPDLIADLEQPYLPFRSGSFDTVVCTEVLEHVDGLHNLFDELVRVARRAVIFSLPNCWRQLVGELIGGGPGKSEYGLPPKPPVDRHKWFFNIRDADAFVAAQVSKHGLSWAEREYVVNRGDLFSFSLGRSEAAFHHPPRKPRSDMGMLERTFGLGAGIAESMLRFALIRGSRSRREMRVVNAWYVLEKGEE